MSYNFSTLNYTIDGMAQSTFLTGIYGTSIVGMYVDSNNLDHGLLYDLTSQQWIAIDDPLGDETVPYGPSIGSFDSGITIVGSYKTEGATNDNGFLFNSALAPGSQYVTINFPDAVNTIPHSNYDGLVVGNYDNSPSSNPDYETYPVSGNAFIYNISTQTFVTNDKPSAVSTTAYGIWNGVIAGGFTDPNSGTGVSLTHGYLYDMASGTWTTYDHPGDALVTHFDGITGGSTANSYILTGDWVSASDPTTPQAFVATITNGIATSWTDLSAPGSALTSGNSGYGDTVIGVYTDPSSSMINGYVATNDVACFAAGTHIDTTNGAVPVERLAVGDEIVTLHSGTQSIKWIGHRHIDCRRHPRPQDVWPVRVEAGAFKAGTPARDLWLSPDHSIYADGTLIPIKHLINGTTIVQEARPAVTYYHVEVDMHDVIMAEGLSCETYLDNGSRNAFANGGGVVQLYPDFGAAERCEASGEAAGCAPLRIEGPAVDRVRARLHRRAVKLGHAALSRPASRRRSKQAAPSIDLVSLLQPDWYLASNPDVAAAGVEAHAHYVTHGRLEGRLPCPEADLIRAFGLVDPATVIRTMPDVVAAEVDVVEHFCLHGWQERRRPNAYFDTDWYVEHHNVPAGMNPLLHYVLVGENQGLAPSRHFDPAWYRQHYQIADTISVLAHYLMHRRTQRFSPLPSFDVLGYCRTHATTLRPARDPFAHFLAIGRFAPSHAEIAA